MNMESDRPSFEPTEPVSSRKINFYNPYESTEPYYQPFPIIPPPPPPPKAKQRTGIYWAVSLCMIGLLLAGAILYLGIAGIPWQQSSRVANSSSVSTAIPASAPTRTAIPMLTATPALTPTLTVHIRPASQIATYFYRIGLAPQTTTSDTSWSCCKYYPEGGAVYWSDLQTGITMDLATFTNINEAQIDAQNLLNKDFGAYVVNYCLLSYSGNPADLSSYTANMQEECIYENG